MWRDIEQHTCRFVYVSVGMNVNCRWMGPVRSAHCVSSGGAFWSARESDGFGQLSDVRSLDRRPQSLMPYNPACSVPSSRGGMSRRCSASGIKSQTLGHRRPQERVLLSQVPGRLIHTLRTSGSGDEERRSKTAGHASWDKTKGQPDMNAPSSLGPREALLRTWIQFREQMVRRPESANENAALSAYGPEVARCRGDAESGRVQVTSKSLQPRQGRACLTGFSLVRCITPRRA